MALENAWGTWLFQSPMALWWDRVLIQVPPEFLSLSTIKQRARETHWKVLLLFPQGLSPELFELNRQTRGPHSQEAQGNWPLVGPRHPILAPPAPPETLHMHVTS